MSFLDAACPCLVIVDFSNGFTDPDSPLYCDCDSALVATKQLLDAARAARAPVVYTTVAYDEAVMESARVLLEKAEPLRALMRGSHAVAIDHRVAPSDGELVIEKGFISAFFGTTLGTYLASERCDTLVVAGTSTSGCVRATVVDGVQHGYRVVVPEEAVADRSEELHRASLFDMGLKYAHVTDLETAEKVFLPASALAEARTASNGRGRSVGERR